MPPTVSTPPAAASTPPVVNSPPTSNTQFAVNTPPAVGTPPAVNTPPTITTPPAASTPPPVTTQTTVSTSPPSASTTPAAACLCPPESPNILINPHFHRHINTAHPTDIRVNVFGSSGFDVTQIDPTTVTFGGAHPVLSFTRHVNRDEWLDETFVFKGTDVQLPPGIIEATISGNLKDGRSFASSSQVFNRDDSYYGPARVGQARARQAANPGKLATPITVLELNALRFGAEIEYPSDTFAAIPTAQAEAPATPAVVSISRREPVVAGQRQGPTIPGALRASMNGYLSHVQAAGPNSSAGAQ